ncbi:MAG TPA: alpha/beta fold hydrolase [Polyangiaceae bacterium]|nr:alpha/beta fold hydrolase [Polyangiaceae bacterium]
MALPTFEIEATEAEQGSVIWLHGLGASNHDFDPIVPELGAPHLRFVFPSAPVRPVTINQGMRMPSWYDILSFDDPPLREEEADVRATAIQIRELIDREVARGVRPDKIVLAGFSQGGAVALHVGLRSERRLAGVMVLSGYLLMPDTLEDEKQPEARLTPFLFCHGRYDPVVPVRLGQSSFARVTQAGYAAEWVEYDMQHSLCLDEVRRIKSWLALRLPREA